MMNIATPREADSAKKLQGSNAVDHIEKNYSKPSSSITSARWSRLRDPRIVRVSRTFGGKDRHSKVCTVKGLRDRRVRLSVPTAIQLYDLQERLGLNQPSKVVDWLLNAAKHDVDELPPLQIPVGNFCPNDHDHQVLQSSHGAVDDSSQLSNGGVKMNNSIVQWESSFGNMEKSREVLAKDRIAVDRGNEGGGGEGEGEEEEDVSANKFFPRSSDHSTIPGLLNNVVPYNSMYRWDPSIFSLSHFTPQADQDNPPNFNVVPLPSLSLPPESQVLLCPTTTTQPKLFPSHGGTNSVDFGQNQISQFQLLSSTSQNPSSPSSTKACQLSMSPNLLQYSQNNTRSRSRNDDGFSLK